MKLFFCLSLLLLLTDAGPLPKKKKKSIFVDDGEDGENGVEVLIEKAGKPSKDDLPENQEADEDEEDITPPPPPSDDSAQMILQDLGFVKPAGLSDSGDVDAEDMIVAAIKDYQKTMGIEETGVLDGPTKDKLSYPRCGQRDDVANLDSSSRLKWSKTELTYAIYRVTGQIDRDRIGDVLRKAFSAWAAVVPLKFREVRTNERPDIKISFETGNHGDGSNFDGRGKVVGHGFFPERGILHFDNDERWVDGDVQFLDKHAGVDLYEAAIHEMGHILGLDHNRKNRNAIMFPSTHPNIEGGVYHPPQLSSDDINAVQSLYGTKTSEGGDENGGDRKGGGSGGPNNQGSHEEGERGGTRRGGRRRGGGRRRKGGNRTNKIAWRHGPYHSYYAFGCDFPGRDIEDFAVDTTDECANECFDAEDCHAWVRDPDGQCFLKGKFDITEAKRVSNRKNICGAWFSSKD